MTSRADVLAGAAELGAEARRYQELRKREDRRLEHARRVAAIGLTHWMDMAWNGETQTPVDPARFHEEATARYLDACHENDRELAAAICQCARWGVPEQWRKTWTDRWQEMITGKPRKRP